MKTQTDPEKFRTLIRTWIEDNYPEQLRQAPGADGQDPRETRPHEQEWLRRMADKGLLAPTWPEKYGGRGLGHVAEVIKVDELNYFHGPYPLDAVEIGNTLLLPRKKVCVPASAFKCHIGTTIRQKILAPLFLFSCHRIGVFKFDCHSVNRKLQNINQLVFLFCLNIRCMGQL